MSNFNHMKLDLKIVSSGKTQTELANELGVHYNTVSAWVNSRAVPHPDKLIATLKILGATDEELRNELLTDWYCL